MKRFLIVGLVLLGMISTGLAQDAVPTLVPPTPVPITPSPEPDYLLTESSVARLQRDGVLRVGILYNEIPFGQYTIQGEVTGFDADLARLLAETWALELELVQVTRQNRFDLLANGTVDLLIAAVVHHRDLDARFEFSQSYRVGTQAIMVQSEPDVEAGQIDIASIFNLGGQPVGYVIGTEGDRALSEWQARTGVRIQPRPYYTYDQMLAALFAGDVVAIAGRDTRLLRTAFNVLDAVELLPTPLTEEPFGIVMLRHDRPMRNLVNRTLQYLASDAGLGQQSTLQQLHTTHFPNDEFPFAALAVYDNVGDEPPSLASVDPAITLPTRYAASNLIETGTLRVAGLGNPDDLPPAQASIASVNRALVSEMASRWGVQVVEVPGDPVQAIAAAQADLAVGITPDWNLVDRVDFSQPYVQHGRRLMYPQGLDRDRLGDLFATSRIVATLRSEPDAQELAQAWGDVIGIFNFRFFQTTAEGAADTILEDNNALVVFGDSFTLLPIVRQNPTELAIGPTWYDRRFRVFAIPRNDLDFSRLVNYTLQEMIEDQALTTITARIIPDGDRAPAIGIWPGSPEYLGLRLGN